MANKPSERGIHVQQNEIHQFLERYFRTNECDILENHDGWLKVQLTVEMDKALMNRPFYWHYVEKTAGGGEPMQLTLITDQSKAPKDLKGEVIHFGSPRLHQIFQSTKKFAAYGRMYENKVGNGTVKNALQPWLGLNVKISYKCDRKKDMLYSIGLNLINGMMVNNFHKQLTSMNLTPKIPDYSFTLSPLIKPQSGLKRMEQVIHSLVDQDDHLWAEEARKRWDSDLNLLEKFYEDIEERPESYYSEKEALQAQYEPKITATIINGGLFYLTQQAINISA